MSSFVIVGAGSVGSRVAVRLADQGHAVTIVSRRGSGPTHVGIRTVALDARRGADLASIAHGASAIFNCANPPYHRWLQEWLPLAAGLLEAARTSGATLVSLGNLYGYGVPSQPMSADDPLRSTVAKSRVRVEMWQDALEAHYDGLIRTVEVRASDFIGACDNTLFGDRVTSRIFAGSSVQVIGDPDAPHSWTFIDDVAATLVAVALEPSSWGRAWHVPTNEPRSQRQVIDDLADAAGVRRVSVTTVSRRLIRLAGFVNPTVRELPKTLYQFERPFVIDDRATRAQFCLAPTPWDEVIASCVPGAHVPIERALVGAH
jgi:nucleoside-diphosphate-sugar epimerase